MKKKKETIVIGLTGSIGMGKSTAAGILSRLGIDCFSADEAVHTALSQKGIIFSKIQKLFPEAIKNGAVNRDVLGKTVFSDRKKLELLEKTVHPVVFKAAKKFIATARHDEKPAIALEIPLLFETGMDSLCDCVVCVTAPVAVQKKRVMKRRGMTKKKLRSIMKRQIINREKQRMANYVVNTGGGYAKTRRDLKRILEEVMEKGKTKCAK